MAVTQVTGAFNLGGGNSGVFTQSGPPTPTANISSATAINEGAALSFTVTTTGIADLTTLYWCVIPGTASLADFTEVTGFFQIVGGVGSFSVTPTSELAASGSTTFAVAVKLNNPIYGETIGVSNSVIKNDTNAITFSSIPSSINEGSSGTFYVATTGVANSTTLYWKIPNTTDFATTTGSFVISANVGSFAVTPTADSLTEGAETFTVELRSGTVTGPVVATSSPVTINDTSTGAVASPTYAFTTTPSSINEGSAGTFIITTTNVSNGTTLYWTVETNAGDFATSSGSFTITANSGTFNVTPTADATTEGAETFTVAVRTVSTGGTIVATSASVTINDTSLSPVTFSVKYLVVGGGGGGPPAGNDSGGGGGGGYRNSNPGTLSGGGAATEALFTAAVGTAYPVVIGGGGTNSNGSPSNFGPIVAAGGGRGGATNAAGSPGGCGGGGGSPAGSGGTGSNGYAGGIGNTDAGGGGGAGSVGFTGQPTSPARSFGGFGLSNSITGSPQFKAGGGGGGNDGPGTTYGFARDGRGDGGTPSFPVGSAAFPPGGGSGGGGVGNGSAAGGAGASGQVILRYPNARTITVGSGLTAPAPGTNATVAPSPSERFTIITAGSGNVTWS